MLIAAHHQKLYGPQIGGTKVKTADAKAASSTNIVRLPRKRVDTVRGLVHVLA
jgi:hypothetical protein